MATHNGKFVAYYRVSTDKQGQSGLGLDAQRDLVKTFLNGGKWEIIGNFTEVESGTRKKLKHRPELEAALAMCKKHKATLVVAKLDRLARDVQFISTLLNSPVKFVCADMPQADRTFLQMMSVFAEYEARKIGERTRDALASVKRSIKETGAYVKAGDADKGVPDKVITKLGAPNPAIAGAIGNQVMKAQADAYAQRVGPIVREIMTKGGATTLREIAEALQARGVETARGGSTWYASSVKNLLERLK